MAAGRIMAAAIITCLTRFSSYPGFATKQASLGCGTLERVTLISATGRPSRRLPWPEMFWASNSNSTSFLDRESIEIGKDRVDILVGKVDLRHRPVSGNHAFPEFRL
jgi:hypothetical protein